MPLFLPKMNFVAYFCRFVGFLTASQKNMYNGIKFLILHKDKGKLPVTVGRKAGVRSGNLIQVVFQVGMQDNTHISAYVKKRKERYEKEDSIYNVGSIVIVYRMWNNF